VFQSTLLKLARMFSEEWRRGSITIRTAESGVTCSGGWLKGRMEVAGEAARGGRPHRNMTVSDHPVCGVEVGFAEIFLMPQPPLLTRRGMSLHSAYRRSAWLSRIPVQAPDEVEPPFLNGSNDIRGTETLNHLRQREPVAEPLALRIPHNGRRLEECGHDVRPRQNKKYVSGNARTPTAWAACRQVDDDETAKELSDAASSRCISQKQVRGCSNQIGREFRITIKKQHCGYQHCVDHSREEASDHICLGIRRSQRNRQLT
jgi:hypothetical protein